MEQQLFQFFHVDKGYSLSDFGLGIVLNLSCGIASFSN